MTGALLQWAERRGYLVSWGPARALLKQVRGDLDGRVPGGGADPAGADGAIDPVFASEQLTFDYDCGDLDDGAVVVVAMPRPAHRVGFTHDGARVNVVLPPTYQRYRPTFEDVRQDLEEHALRGSRVVTLNVPLKLLAARLGLVRYGRNNLGYVPGFGSYIQLLGYVTDAPLAAPPGWTPREPALLDECEACGICAALCPTAAIDESRVLLKAERCLTLANENPGAWPAHVPTAAHHCLIGCLSCQQGCPANPPLPIVASGVVFDGDETRALLDDDDREGPVWNLIRNHLQALGQPYHEPVVGRNLRALLRPETPAR